MSLSINQIAKYFDNVLDDSDELIVLHSGLWRFGHLLRPFSKVTLNQLIEAFLEVVGPNRTLLIPAYTGTYFPRHRCFDTVRTPPETGLLAKLASKNRVFNRTRSPMNSYLVKGPESEKILSAPCSTAWGKESIMSLLAERNGRFVIIGEVWHESCSYYHHAEELIGVPYRYYKCFQGELYEDGFKIGNCQEVMFVKSLRAQIDDLYVGPEEELKKRNLVKQSDAPFTVESALIGDITNVTCELLTDDPFMFIQNEQTVRRLIATGMRSEIESLEDSNASILNSQILARF